MLEEVADDSYLLEILLAEVGALRLGEVEETADNDGDTGEVARATGTFHYFLDRAEVVDVADRLGVHLLDGGDESNELALVGLGSLEGGYLGEVGIDGAGVLFEVLLVVELDGVDEKADDYEVVFAASARDERQVAFVKCAHGGDEAYGKMIFFGVADGLSEGGCGVNCLHFIEIRGGLLGPP